MAPENTTPLSLADRITDEVLRELEDRKGFDWWWDELDDEIQGDIKDALKSRVQKALDENKPDRKTRAIEAIKAATEYRDRDVLSDEDAETLADIVIAAVDGYVSRITK